MLATCALLLFSLADVQAQGANSPGLVNLPNNPPVGIGTQLIPGGPQNALHIHYHQADGLLDTAIIRLSEGDTTTSSVFGILGLMPYPNNQSYSSLSRGEDLILHEHSQGDLILTNYQSTSLTHPYGAIRFATTPSPATLPIPPPIGHDLERITILPSGNIGFDLLPDTSATGLGNPLEQMQLGGGSIAPPGYYLDPIPGLSFYGGNRFEGMNIGGIISSVDDRFSAR